MRRLEEGVTEGAARGRGFIKGAWAARFAGPPRDALYDDLWPVMAGLQLVGAFPISRNKRTGERGFRLVSPAACLSAASYVGILVALGFVHRAEIAQLRDEHFDRAVPVLLNVLFDLLLVGAPLCYWLEARPLAALLTAWITLQAEFEAVTRTRLRLRLRRRAVLLASALCVGSLLLEACYALQMAGAGADSRFDAAMMSTSVCQDLMRNLLCAFWHLLCRAHVVLSAHALRCLQQEHVGMPADRVLQYRLLWLRLSAHVRQVGNAAGYTFGFYLGYLFVTLMLSVYQTATGARYLAENSVSLIEAAIIASCIFVFCDSAHRTTAHVAEEWISFLLRMRAASSSHEARAQLGDFLETCAAHAPVVRLADYVTVDRTLLVSMTSAMITYLVVLVQFKMAAVEEPVAIQRSNATNSSSIPSS